MKTSVGSMVIFFLKCDEDLMGNLAICNLRNRANSTQGTGRSIRLGLVMATAPTRATNSKTPVSPTVTR